MEKLNPNIHMQRECLERRFIKEELMRYYMYHDRCIELASDIIAISTHRLYTQEDMKGTSDKNKIALSIIDLQSNLRYYQNKIKMLDQWLQILTPSQYQVAKVYILEYQCQDRRHAANELCCEEETVKKQTERIIKRIHNQFHVLL